MPKIKTPKLSSATQRGSSAHDGLRASSVLPAWSSAVPFWLGAEWLWLAVNADSTSFWRGSGDYITHAGVVDNPLQLTSPSTFQAIVLDCRSVQKLDSAWWPFLSARLGPGGLLVVCHGSRRAGAELQTRAPDLALAGGHIFELRQDDTWWLRPDTRPMLRFISALVPPYGRRAWLASACGNFGLHGRHVRCLLAWKGAAPS